MAKPTSFGGNWAVAVMVALIQAELKFPSWTECGNCCLRDFKIVVLDSLRWYKIFVKS